MECHPQGIYRPRNAQATALYHLVEDHFDELERVWDERYEKQHGFPVAGMFHWRPVIRHVVEQFLDCGDLKLWHRPERPPPRAPDRSIQYDPDIPAFDEVSQWSDANE